MTRSKTKLSKEKAKSRPKGFQKTGPPKMKKKRVEIDPSQIQNYARRTRLVIRRKIARSRESVMYKSEKRKMESAGHVFEKFDPISQEEKRIGPFQIESELADPRFEKEVAEEEENKIEEEQEEVDLARDLKEEMEYDEFAPFINKNKEPKVFMTTMFNNPTRRTYLLMQGTNMISELLYNRSCLLTYLL